MMKCLFCVDGLRGGSFIGDVRLPQASGVSYGAAPERTAA